MKPLGYFLAALLFGIAVCLIFAPEAEARVRCVDSAISLPYSGTIYHSSTDENVQVSGTVRVRARVVRSGRCQIKARLIDATATGETSGNAYRAFGSTRFFPGDPMRNATITRRRNFKLEAVPPNPIQPGTPRTISFPIDLTLTFNDRGRLVSGTAEEVVT